MTEFPERILNKIKEAQEQGLTVLDLTNNQLKELPESITNLSTLTVLGLWNNQLTSLPKSITNLSNLKILNLSGNQLKSLPESIPKLSSLTTLNLSSNRLKELPESITKIPSLTTLNLSNNQLKELPESIANLSNLIELNLSYNQLKNLPKSITKLSNLKRLNLNNNQLTNLSESIIKISNLQGLFLSNNPLDIPPIEIANRGIEDIREYFQQLKEQGKDYIYEAKLLIVGEPGSGKTSLANKIQDPEYQLIENEKSTEGIDVIEYSFPLNNKKNFKVNIWDFGGQEIYHATHQFFLTKRSLYALVADIRREDTDFYYWLNIVELLSDHSPLLIIKNEKQDRRIEISERELRGQFNNFKETLATNLKTNRGLEKIVEKIKHYIQDLPHIGQTLPATWVVVRKALENDDRNYISLQEFFEICQANGFTREEDKLLLSGYLHDLGVCLHFQEEDNSILYKTVILKPEWGTFAVYKVLDNQKVINNQGCFTRNDLKEIWQEEKYTAMRGELLELMKKFQLCYEISDRKNTFIAPQLLSKIKPDYEWDELNNLILRYTYLEFMPKGIVTRFIVIMHKYIQSKNNKQSVWRTGVVLEKDNNLAEIIENHRKREIIIRVVGDTKRDFLTTIATQMDEISDSFRQLKYQKLIPCNCSICKNNQNPHSYDYKKLTEWIFNGRQTTQCDNQPYEIVNILSLISDALDWDEISFQDKKIGKAKAMYFGNIGQLIFQNGEQGSIQGDFQEGDRSRNQNISGNITNTGTNTFSLGDNYGAIANKVNQLNFDDDYKNELKQLLIELLQSVAEEDLEKEEKEESLEQISAIANALQDNQNKKHKRQAKASMGIIQDIASELTASSAMVSICQELSNAIAKIF